MLATIMSKITEKMELTEHLASLKKKEKKRTSMTNVVLGGKKHTF